MTALLILMKIFQNGWQSCYSYDSYRKDNIWLENTSQKMAFNHLSYSTTARNVLAVDENGIKIIKTPVYDAGKTRAS